MAPNFVSAETSSDGAEIRLSYDEPLSTTTPESSAFNVSVDGETAEISQVSVNGSDLALGLTESILPSQAVLVSYTAPAPNLATTNRAIQNAAGVDAASINNINAANNSTVPSDADLSFNRSTLNSIVDNRINAISSGDFNRDNITDLVVSNIESPSSSSAGLTTLLGDGSGGFTTSSTTTAAGTRPNSIAVSDFNGDGDQDVAVTDQIIYGNLAILLGNGSGAFASATSIGTGPAVGGVAPQPRIVTSSDFNEDGRTDIAWTIDYNTTSIPGQIGVALNNGTNDPFIGVTVAYHTVGINPYGLVATDVNNDGNIDLVSANSPSNAIGSISVLLGNGNGTFQAAANTAVGDNPRYFAKGDFNRDGSQDLALSQSGDDNNISMLLGDGSGSFNRSILSLSSDQPRQLISNDFNGDGLLDLAAATFTGDNVYIFPGLGDGTFSTAKVFAAGNGPIFMASADFDRNGLPDLAVANYGKQPDGSYAAGTSTNVTLLLNSTTLPQQDTSTNQDTTPGDDVPAGVLLQARDNDGDGLREAVQDIQGNRIDANHDGIQDADQHNVTAIHLINDGSMHGDFGAISVNSQYQLTSAILTKHDSALSLSHPIETVNAFNGTVSFAVLGIPTGGSIDAIISLPESLSSDHNQKYFAFNYITQLYEHYADSNGSPLYQFTDSDYDKIPASVALTLTDGNPLWDGDGITNGTVICKGFLGRDNVEGTSRSIVNAATAGPPSPSPINAIAINQASDGLDSNLPTGSVSARCFYGQEGTDIITGHKGHDLFIYQSISESQADLYDTVKFGRRDRFVLSSIDGNGLQEGMQSLSFVDEQAFSNHPGELRASASILEADTDGDGLADFKINLRSDHLINSNNLIL